MEEVEKSHAAYCCCCNCCCCCCCDLNDGLLICREEADNSDDEPTMAALLLRCNTLLLLLLLALLADCWSPNKRERKPLSALLTRPSFLEGGGSNERSSALLEEAESCLREEELERALRKAVLDEGEEESAAAEGDERTEKSPLFAQLVELRKRWVALRCMDGSVRLYMVKERE